MISANFNHSSKNQIARYYLRRLVVLALCLICVSGSISQAQSGRRQTQTEAEVNLPKSSHSNADDKKVNQSTTLILPEITHQHSLLFLQPFFPDIN